jgi:hypothetical protein
MGLVISTEVIREAVPWVLLALAILWPLFGPGAE